mgnify:CR=1 FL=1
MWTVSPTTDEQHRSRNLGSPGRSRRSMSAQVLNRVDPTYAASRAHFADLLARYGAPLAVLVLEAPSVGRARGPARRPRTRSAAAARGSAAAGLQDISTDPVLANIVAMSSSNQDKWICRAVYSWARKERHPTTVSSPEPPGPKGAEPGVMLGVLFPIEVNGVYTGSWPIS